MELATIRWVVWPIRNLSRGVKDECENLVPEFAGDVEERVWHSRHTRSRGFAWAEMLILNPRPVRLEQHEVEVKPQETMG